MCITSSDPSAPGSTTSTTPRLRMRNDRPLRRNLNDINTRTPPVARSDLNYICICTCICCLLVSVG